MSRPVPAPQPDLSGRLLAAIAERDATLAARLGQRWVHRRGLGALDGFLLTAVAPIQGLEAAQWLRGQLGLVEAVAPVPLFDPVKALAEGEEAFTEVPVQAVAPEPLVLPLQAPATPAPAPASLAALCAWLPDADDDGRDFPRTS